MANYQNNYNQRGNYKGNKQNTNRNRDIKAKRLPSDYVQQAENVIKAKERNKRPTTTQMRRLLSSVLDIYNEESRSTDTLLKEDNRNAIKLAEMRMVYQASRDWKVKDFLYDAEILDYMKGIENNREKFIEFFHYLEALIAYHKFYGGRE